MNNRFRIMLVVAFALAFGLGAGAAHAYFTSSASGTGSAGTGTMQIVTVAAATAVPSTPLRPGGTGDVTLKVTNPNSYPVTLVSVTSAAGTITADSGHPACTTTGVIFTDQTGLSTTLAAGSTTTIDLPGAASMSTASSAGCQGAMFSIPVTIAVRKS